MTLGLMTRSILMDGKEYIRTFQNAGVRYRDIIDITNLMIAHCMLFFYSFVVMSA